MPKKAVLVEKKAGICAITLNRPDVMNAVNMEVFRDFDEIIDRIKDDEETRVVILSGAGKHFSSGADMHLLHNNKTASGSLTIMKRLSRLVLKIRSLPQPIITKVHGVAYGVGSNIALCGDFVIAAHNTRFCEVFVNIGVMMDGGGTYFLPRLVGMAKAREIALLGEEFSGKEAAKIGLIYKSTPEKKLDSEVKLLADKLLARPASALEALKEGLERSLDMSLGEALEWEASHQSILLQSEEHRAAIRSFLESKDKM